MTTSPAECAYRRWPLARIAAAGVALAALPLLVRGRTPRIACAKRPDGIAALEKLTIGNAEQWVLIRSENTHNPVILFVHGGPGTSQLTLMRRNTRSIERYFTVVNWDQRGAGKSYRAARDRDRMHLEQFVADTIELSEQLRDRFGQQRITLVGHSWGSALGVLAVARRPDLFDAYVGIGQVSNAAQGERISYDWTLAQAEAAGDDGVVRKLKEIGPPPYRGHWRPKFMTERRFLGRYGGEYHGSRQGAFGVVLKNLVLSTEYTLVDRVNFFRGILDSVAQLMPELQTVDLFERVPRLEVPVWFMLGRHDYEVPSVLSARYFDALEAPAKTLVWFEHSAHMPNTEERDRFNQILVDQVLPVSRGGSPPA